MRLWDLIFIVLLFVLYWIVLGDKMEQVKSHRIQHGQGVGNVIRPSTK